MFNGQKYDGFETVTKVHHITNRTSDIYTVQVPKKTQEYKNYLANLERERRAQIQQEKSLEADVKSVWKNKGVEVAVMTYPDWEKKIKMWQRFYEASLEQMREMAK